VENIGEYTGILQKVARNIRNIISAENYSLIVCEME
jgi:hypothetical protein